MKHSFKSAFSASFGRWMLAKKNKTILVLLVAFSVIPFFQNCGQAVSTTQQSAVADDFSSSEDELSIDEPTQDEVVTPDPQSPVTPVESSPAPTTPISSPSPTPSPVPTPTPSPLPVAPKVVSIPIKFKINYWSADLFMPYNVTSISGLSDVMDVENIVQGSTVVSGVIDRNEPSLMLNFNILLLAEPTETVTEHLTIKLKLKSGGTFTMDTSVIGSEKNCYTVSIVTVIPKLGNTSYTNNGKATTQKFCPGGMPVLKMY